MAFKINYFSKFTKQQDSKKQDTPNFTKDTDNRNIKVNKFNIFEKKEKSEDIMDSVKTYDELLYSNIKRDFESSSEYEEICDICNTPIRSKHTMIKRRENGKPIHFDCAIKELRQEYFKKIRNNEKIYYIGNGNFAIVKEIFDKRGNLRTFEIIEKIEYEKRH